MLCVAHEHKQVTQTKVLLYCPHNAVEHFLFFFCETATLVHFSHKIFAFFKKSLQVFKYR